MSEELTQHQTAGGRSTAKQLSMLATTPPAEVPGYRLQHFLGAGAFGQVWVGQDLNTGRGVAVKFYLHRGGVNWSLLSREVKHLVQLSADRYVVQVLEVGWDADPPYYVMELVRGGSLEDLLKARVRLPVGEAVEIFRKICIGLNHCHAKGVLHCDIKPANVLMAEDLEPRLADFGQSRMSHDQTPALGTLFYMAPEQADLNATPDASWDVYGAGAILYRMLTGSPPYRDETVVADIDTAGSLPKRLQRYREAIARNPPPAAHLRRTGVDRELAAIVNRCLAADPQQRYGNIQLILDDLSLRERNRARRPLMLLGIVGPLILLCATCFFGWRTIHQATQQTTEALRQEAFGSNQLAARFAARTLETEIDRYFNLAREEAGRGELQTALRDYANDPASIEWLAPIREAPSSMEALRKTAAREKVLDDPRRLELDRILNERLRRYSGESGDPRRPQLSTMFLVDDRGTIVAIAYDEPVSRASNSAGRNYAFRTYFHGESDDLPRDTPIDEIRPLRSTHLSSAFRSTATGTWKVAVSTPILLDDDDIPDAYFVATLNLGDFKLPQSPQGASQIAVLVDAREGHERGTILQHPLLDRRREEGRVVEDDPPSVPRGLMRRLLEGGDVDYQDPFAEADDGDDFAGNWIAAMQPVELPSPPEDDAPQAGKTADLLVLVQYRLDTVLAPVGQLGKSLLWEGVAAVTAILGVTLALWMLVLRASAGRGDPDEGPAAGGTSPPEAVETVDAR